MQAASLRRYTADYISLVPLGFNLKHRMNTFWKTVQKMFEKQYGFNTN